MARTRKPLVYEARGEWYTSNTLAIMCPYCKTWNLLGIGPRFETGYDFSRDDMIIRPDFVCLSRNPATERYICNFSGPIKVRIAE